MLLDLRKEQPITREHLYNLQYFCGYKYSLPLGYADFNWHETTARHVIVRRPESVLELGCGRGYVLKRLQDAGIRAEGVDISKHAYLTRVADNIYNSNFCRVAVSSFHYDLCLSMSFMDCIPEADLPDTLALMERCTKRGLHGIDMEGEATPDRPTIKPKEWWRQIFDAHGLQSHEVFTSAELERGPLPPDVLVSDGKAKLNLGCGHAQFLRGWQNIDKEDFAQFAQSQNTIFVKHDVKSGLVQNTSTVDLIFISHLLEHLTYEEALRLLRECRRVLKPTGAMRIIATDVLTVAHTYAYGDHVNVICDLDELDASVASAATDVNKLWVLLASGRQSFYDHSSLVDLCVKAGFLALTSSFRQYCCHQGYEQASKQILAETIETCGVNLFVDAIPKTA